MRGQLWARWRNRDGTQLLSRPVLEDVYLNIKSWQVTRLLLALLSCSLEAPSGR